MKIYVKIKDSKIAVTHNNIKSYKETKKTIELTTINGFKYTLDKSICQVTEIVIEL